MPAITGRATEDLNRDARPRRYGHRSGGGTFRLSCLHNAAEQPRRARTRLDATAGHHVRAEREEFRNGAIDCHYKVAENLVGRHHGRNRLEPTRKRPNVRIAIAAIDNCQSARGAHRTNELFVFIWGHLDAPEFDGGTIAARRLAGWALRPSGALRSSGSGIALGSLLIP